MSPFGLVIAAAPCLSQSDLNFHRRVFQLALAFDGLRLKNSLQLYGLVMFQVAMLAYAALMPAQLREALEAIGRLDVWRIVEGMLIAIPIVLGVSIVMVAAMTYFIQIEIGWSVFKLLGASLGIKRMFFFYQILVTLLYACGRKLALLYCSQLIVASGPGQEIRLVCCMTPSHLLTRLLAYAYPHQVLLDRLCHSVHHPSLQQG